MGELDLDICDTLMFQESLLKIIRLMQNTCKRSFDNLKKLIREGNTELTKSDVLVNTCYVHEREDAEYIEEDVKKLIIVILNEYVDNIIVDKLLKIIESDETLRKQFDDSTFIKSLHIYRKYISEDDIHKDELMKYVIDEN